MFKKSLLAVVFGLVLIASVALSASAWNELGEACFSWHGYRTCFYYVVHILETPIVKLPENVCLSCPRVGERLGEGITIRDLEMMVNPEVHTWAMTDVAQNKYLLDFDEGALVPISSPVDVCYDLEGQTVCQGWSFTPSSYCTETCEGIDIEGHQVMELPELTGTNTTTMLLQDMEGAYTYLLDFETGAFVNLSD